MRFRPVGIFVFLRFLVGGIYFFSGFEKLISPHENFVYVIQNYDVIRSSLLIEIVAGSFPWLELITGTFALLGLWLRMALFSIGFFSVTFIVIVGQAIIRHLPIHECGCFGDLLSVPLPVIIVMDTVLLMITIVLWRFREYTASLSLDKYFAKGNSQSQRP